MTADRENDRASKIWEPIEFTAADGLEYENDRYEDKFSIFAEDNDLFDERPVVEQPEVKISAPTNTSINLLFVKYTARSQL